MSFYQGVTSAKYEIRHTISEQLRPSPSHSSFLLVMKIKAFTSSLCANEKNCQAQNLFYLSFVHDHEFVMIVSCKQSTKHAHSDTPFAPSNSAPGKLDVV